MPHILVWDLETIPDISALAAGQRIKLTEAQELAKSEFPKLIYHQVVCIGALLCVQKSGAWEVESVGAPNTSERTEEDIIRSFVDRIETLKPQLITFNGSSFDLPVLRYRAMYHHIGAKGLSSRNYFSRYTDDALDLCDVLSSYDPRSRMSLDAICKVMGLTGKSAEISGADVQRFVAAGKIKAVAEYCESDVVNTYRLWLRYELFRGTLQRDKFENSEANLRNFIKERADTKPYLQNLI